MGKREIGKRRAVFLDRDGVLNEAVVRDGKPYPPAGPEEMKIAEGAPEACLLLKNAGFFLVVVTNQPDVARGTQSRETVEAINARLLSLLPIDDVRVCYHDEADNCACRKPKPGLIIQAAEDWDIDRKRSFLIGDRWKDIEAGKKADCTTIFIDREYREKLQSEPDFTTQTMMEAARWILRRQAE
jgi:D-glycero-D-manno-heptose 1,7-bisphosphate phosphatase